MGPMTTAFGEAVGKITGGLVVFVLAMSVILLPLPAASALYGSNWGASVGCVVSALLQCGIIALVRRFPNVPGAAVVTVVCGHLLVMMVVFAPIGVAIEVIADRATATWTGLAMGVGFLALGYLVRTRIGRGLR